MRPRQQVREILSECRRWAKLNREKASASEGLRIENPCEGYREEAAYYTAQADTLESFANWLKSFANQIEQRGEP